MIIITDSALALIVTLMLLCDSLYVNITTTHISCNEHDNDNDNYIT